jgi:DNA-directed RNA polymerase specialized sigma24 family protein
VTDDEQLAKFYHWLRKQAGNLIGFDDPGLDDLVQEGYIAMWKGLKDYDPDRGPLVPRLQWLAKRRMQSVAYGTHRETGHEPMRGSQEPPDVLSYDQWEEPEYYLPEHDDEPYVEPQLMEALNDLPYAQREYVFVRFWIAGGVFGRTPAIIELGKQYPVLRNDKLWKRAKQTLASDPRMLAAAGIENSGS